MSLLLLWVVLPNDAVAESEDFCAESVCEYHFHYQKVRTIMTSFDERPPLFEKLLYKQPLDESQKYADHLANS